MPVLDALLASHERCVCRLLSLTWSSRRRRRRRRAERLWHPWACRRMRARRAQSRRSHPATASSATPTARSRFWRCCRWLRAAAMLLQVLQVLQGLQACGLVLQALQVLQACGLLKKLVQGCRRQVQREEDKSAR